MQLGNKASSAVNTIGDEMRPIINTVGNAVQTVNKAKQIYSNLEKIIPRRRLAQ